MSSDSKEPAESTPAAARTAKPTPFSQPDALNWVVITVALLAMGGSLFMGWRILQPGSQAATTPSLTLPVPQPTATPDLPVLKLNASHQRRGAEITVHPDQIGRDNPFQ